jgi:hypothetical protein
MGKTASTVHEDKVCDRPISQLNPLGRTGLKNPAQNVNSGIDIV